MSLIVQKFGGSSLASIECIQQVAKKISLHKKEGHDLVVVVSAMGGETDRLDSLARQLNARPCTREMDVLLATGEQVSIALLCIALQALGCQAQSFTGAQVAIKSCSTYTKARILNIDDKRIKKALADQNIVVVAGFQGINSVGDITTLGRGGSDTTAVGLAVALKADECQIYTDVEGVYTTDPRVEPRARKLSHITFEEMLELSSLGAKVLQLRSIEFAGKYNVPLRVLSTFKEGSGTLITYEGCDMKKSSISGIAFNKAEAKLTIRGVPDKPGIASQILGAISLAQIDVDMIIQNQASDKLADFTFTVHRRDYEEAYEILQTVCKKLGAKEVDGEVNIAKISLVGVGMRSHAGIASTMFQALGAEGINIQLISTSEIKISVVINEKYLELGVRTLHEAFKLHETCFEDKLV